MNNFIIFGGSCLIGSHLVRELRHQGILDITIADSVKLGWEFTPALETGLQRTIEFFTVQQTEVLA